MQRGQVVCSRRRPWMRCCRRQVVSAGQAGTVVDRGVTRLGIPLRPGSSEACQWRAVDTTCLSCGVLARERGDEVSMSLYGAPRCGADHLSPRNRNGPPPHHHRRPGYGSETPPALRWGFALAPRPGATCPAACGATGGLRRRWRRPRARPPQGWQSRTATSCLRACGERTRWQPRPRTAVRYG
jgi:hypothetical protein